MKNKFLKVFVFIFFVVCLDKAIGAICKNLYYKSNDDTIYRLTYTLNSTKEDILIFGPSRAQNHFIPKVISETTGLSSYNCGFGGEGLLFSLIQLNEVFKRYKPKLIVLEVSPNVLFDPESEKKLKILLPFNKKDTLIYNALINGEMFERVKLLSAIYPYNSTIASLISGGYKPNVDTLNGFKPLEGLIDTNGITNKINAEFSSASIRSQRLDFLKRFITLCNNHNREVVVVVSPVYQTNEKLNEMIKQIESTCSKFENVYFLNYSKMDCTYQQTNCFKDNLHLNFAGAKVFSQVIAEELKEIIYR